MTASLWWSRPDKMGSSDKNSIAAYPPITACDSITIIQEDSVIWWHLLMKNLHKTASILANIDMKNILKSLPLMIYQRIHTTWCTAVQSDLQVNNLLVSMPTPYSQKRHLWPTLYTISQRDTSEPWCLVVRPLSGIPIQIWSSGLKFALSQQIWYTAFVVCGTRTWIRLRVP